MLKSNLITVDISDIHNGQSSYGLSMKKIIVLIHLITWFNISNAQKTFVVEGKINNYKGKVYLYYGDESDSVITTNGKFLFKGKVISPVYSSISIPSKVMLGITPFWIDEGRTLLELDTASFKNNRFSGLDVTGKVIESGKTNKFIDSVNLEIGKIKAQSIPDSDKTVQVRAITDKILMHYPDHILSTYFVSTNLSYYNKKELDAIYGSLNSELKTSSYALSMKNRYLKKVDVVIGERMPDFSQQDQFGKSVSIAEFKGKYVLIDFWASWCIPCRKENPNVVSAYAKYHSKGFQILAVSLDTSKSSWLKAIKNDNLSWTHVSDLGGWENEVSRMLKVSEVPSNILVDQNGIVIAKNLKGDNLHRKLAELFDNSQK